MSIVIARSSPECHLYMELHPCTCGETRGPTQHKLVSREDDLAAVYEGPCPRCGTTRTFEFLLDPEIPPGDKFGGSNASKLIDAGQYLAVADAAARQVPGGAETLVDEARREARWWMNRAVNALEEVLKFIPAAEDRVPESALFTADGKAVYAREPGRFRRSRLNAVLGVYREMLAKLGTSSAPRRGE